jgi:Squalene-hopene cyclase C-terminal domain/Prenyltransferase and squalene oxidase repeat
VGLTAATLALVVAVTPAQFLQSHQQPDGGFAEPGGTAAPQLTAWAAVGLVAAGAPTGSALAYLEAREAELASTTDVALVAIAERALGGRPDRLLDRLRPGADGSFGQVNATVWAVLALRQSGRPVPPATTRFLLRQQRASGGWSWARGGKPDSNDTAAALQALRALGVSGRPIERGLAYLRAFQNRDGGFELSAGRGSDAQSTAWAIQAFLAAGRKPGRAAYAYLALLRQPDGSYRYSARYATTPVWVTAQVLTAVSGRSFPLSVSSRTASTSRPLGR